MASRATALLAAAVVGGLAKTGVGKRVGKIFQRGRSGGRGSNSLSQSQRELLASALKGNERLLTAAEQRLVAGNASSAALCKAIHVHCKVIRVHCKVIRVHCT